MKRSLEKSILGKVLIETIGPFCIIVLFIFTLTAIPYSFDTHKGCFSLSVVWADYDDDRSNSQGDGVGSSNEDNEGSDGGEEGSDGGEEGSDGGEEGSDGGEEGSDGGEEGNDGGEEGNDGGEEGSDANDRDNKSNSVNEFTDNAKGLEEVSREKEAGLVGDWGNGK